MNISGFLKVSDTSNVITKNFRSNCFNNTKLPKSKSTGVNVIAAGNFSSSLVKAFNTNFAGYVKKNYCVVARKTAWEFHL